MKDNEKFRRINFHEKGQNPWKHEKFYPAKVSSFKVPLFVKLKKSDVKINKSKLCQVCYHFKERTIEVYENI